MRRGWAILFAVLFPMLARAHVGSPNVFFEGQAGPYPVRVVIRPPSVVPGLAEISVRVPGAQQVTVLPVFWQTGKKGAPPPDVAELVRGETNLFAATLWFMKSGAYSIELDVTGTSGRGTVTVPVNSVATTRRDLPVGMGTTLALLGAFLFVMAVRLAGLSQGESLLEPGAPLPRKMRVRSWLAMVGALLLYSSAIAAGRYWWNAVDSDYRNNRLFRATPVVADVRAEGDQRILRLEMKEEDERRGIPQLIPDHGKIMHLFMVREPDLEVFAHLHPIQRDKKQFEVALPPLVQGTYRIYADVTHESGFSQTMVATAEVPEPSPSVAARWSEVMAREPVCATPLALASGTNLFLGHDPDDSWHRSMAERGPQTAGLVPVTVLKNSLTCPVANGATMVWEQNGPLVENREATLHFKILSASGQPLRAEAYMGMFGHAAVRRKDGAVFAHLHPMGTISMASQQYFENRERAGARGRGDDQPVHQSGTTETVTFPYEFPQSGPYRIWVQMKSAGRVYTGVFDAEVQAAK